MATHPDSRAASFASQQQGRGAADGAGTMLEQLTCQIQERIAEVEQRHAEAMHDLQSKLERMSGSAVKARPAMPAELASAFSRIETGMADLVERIAETAPDKRRNAEAFVFGSSKPQSTHFVFNPPKRVPVAPVATTRADGSSEPWDQASAEALAQLYESGEAVLAKSLPEAALFAPAQRARAATPAQPEVELPAAQPEPMVQQAFADPARPSAAVVTLAGLGDDRDWLDGRLSGLAEHVSKSIADARPDGAFKTLMSRVDQLETRFTSALDGIASKSDVAAMRNDTLGQVEVQIKELATHIESTHQQLTRLDAIEQHLSDLTAYASASMDAQQTHAGAAGDSAQDLSYDFAQLADLAVERALARAPAQIQPLVDDMHPAETQARVDAVHALLQDFAAERRRGDEYTTGMLETVQEALVRLIDRVDAIDVRAPAQVMPMGEAPHTFAPQIAAAMPAATVAVAAQHVAVAQPPADRHAAVPIEDTQPRNRAANRRAPRVMIEPVEDMAEAAMAPAVAPEEAAHAHAPLPVQPEVNIKDLRLNARKVSVTVPGTKPDAKVTSRTPAAEPAADGVKPVIAAAAPIGGSGKTGLYVAVTALSLVGIGFMAQHLFTGGEAPSTLSVPATAPAAKAPVAMPTTGVDKSRAPAGPVPQAVPGTLPPGMMAPSAGQRLETPTQRPGDVSIDRPGTPKPAASVPETVNDDLSMSDGDANDGQAPAALAALPQPAPRAPSGPVQASSQPMQGLALALPNGRPAAPDIAGMQRQFNQASASERVGAMARPASEFSQRFGQPLQQQQAAPVAPPAAAIVTGSMPTPRVPAATDAGLGEVVADPIEMPPAQVGPLSLRMAAARGDASAAFEVATRLAEGRGIKQDFKQAIGWYQRAAAKGLAIAQYRLGTLFERGLGTSADPVRARGWYKRAADQGNVKAMHNMAVLSAGNGQTAPDYATAAKWFKDAADRGLPDSQFNLGVLYENGLGVTKDPRQAYLWFSLAARQGDTEAVRRRDQILATFDAADVKAGNDDVQKWRARPTDVRINDPRVAGDQWRNAAAQLDAVVETAPQAPLAVNAGALPQPRTIRIPQRN